MRQDERTSLESRHDVSLPDRRTRRSAGGSQAHLLDADSATLHGWFARCAGRMPAAPSLTFRETTLTYGELDGLAGGIAAQLVRADVQRGDLVGICVSREQAVPAILGVLKAGAACVPLDPRYPDARLAHLLDRVAARVVVADDGGAA